MLYDLKTAIDAVDPRLFYVLVALITFGVIYGWRRLFPETFERIPPKLQSLPAIILGAVLSGASDTATLKQAVVAAILGACSSGLAAIGGHHALKAGPGPYGTKEKEDGGGDTG